ncbi:MAG: TSUP family transporter [Christensenellales bacterium]
MIAILIGVFSGILGGMGMGGGALMVPLMIWALSLSQHAVQGLNLISFLPAALAATVIHWKKKRFDKKQVFVFCWCALLGAAAGAVLAQLTDAVLLRRSFGIFLFVLGVWQWWKAEKDNKREKEHKKS